MMIEKKADGSSAFMKSWMLITLLLVCFCCCAKGEALNLPANIESIEDYAFANCTQFEGHLTLPEGLKSIGSHAFDGCTSMYGPVLIPESVQFIGEGAFDNTGLTPVYWQEYVGRFTWVENADGITITGYRRYVDEPSDLIIPSSIEGKTVTEIGERAFCLRQELTGALVLPDGLKRIGDNAFYDTKFTGSLVLPDSLERIGAYAFADNEFKGSIVLPDSMERVGENAFFGCSGLSGQVVIPRSVIYWGGFVFGLTEVKEIWNHWAIGWDIEDDGAVIFSIRGHAEGTVELPETLDGKPVVQLGGHQRNLLAEAFNPQNAGVIEGTLIVPSTVKIIDDEAFLYANGRDGKLSGKVVLSEGLTSIGRSAFYQSGITEINFPKGLKTIGREAFAWCSDLTGDIVIPEGVVRIGAEAFSCCGNLNGTLSLPDSLREVESYTFYMTPLHGELKLPAYLEKIGRNAFGWTGFSSLASLPEGLTTIGDLAFCPASFLDEQDIYIPASVTYIGCDAFEGWFGNAKLHYAGEEPLELSWLIEREYDDGGYVVVGCNNVETDHVVLPTTYRGEPVIGVGFCALTGCSNLKGELIIPEGYVTLNNQAFEGCGFTGVPVIPSTMKSLYVGALGCSGLSGHLELSEDIALYGDPFEGSNLTVTQGDRVIYEP